MRLYVWVQLRSSNAKSRKKKNPKPRFPAPLNLPASPLQKMSAILSRRRPSLLLEHLRHLCTTTATSSTSKPSGASAKRKLRKTFDSDDAISVINSSSPSDSSSRFALDLAVRRLARSRRYSDIQSLIQSHQKNSPNPSDESFISNLILTYSSARMLSHARQLFDDIPTPTSASFNALLTAHIKSNKPHLVPDLFLSLPQSHPSIIPDSISYSILIKSLCLSGKPESAFQSFLEMKTKDMQPNAIIYTTLIDSFFKKGNPDEARRLWDEMVGPAGIKPDLPAYNVKAMYPAVNGTPDEVLEVIEEAKAAGLKPDAITYNYLINSYCRQGRFEEAKEAYRGFMKKRIDPNAAVFKMLVNSLCSNGDFEGGMEVCRDSMKHNKIPDFGTLRILVEGLVKGGKVEEGKEVIRVVKERFPKDLVRKWTKVEKELGLSVDEEATEQLEAA